MKSNGQLMPFLKQGAQMYILKIAIMATIGLFSAAAQAADKAADSTSPIAASLPQPKHDVQQYLFTLKANGISVDVTPQEFCKKLDYGEAVLSGPPVPEIKDSKVISVISWVICRFSNASN